MDLRFAALAARLLSTEEQSLRAVKHKKTIDETKNAMGRAGRRMQPRTAQNRQTVCNLVVQHAEKEWMNDTFVQMLKYE